MRRSLLIVAACAVILTLGATVGWCQDGLLGYWKMDEGSDDMVTDSSANQNDGDIIGAQWARGSFGTALQFDGSDCQVRIPQIEGLDGSQEMTMEAWVMWEGGGQYPNIVSGGRWSPGGFLFFVTNQVCQFRMGTPDAAANDGSGKWGETSSMLINGFETGRWYHLAATFSRPQITTYLDGQQVGQANWDYAVGYSGDIVLGNWHGGVSHQGLIDEFKLYNRALTAEEIGASYAAQSEGRSGEVSYEVIPDSMVVDPLITLRTKHLAMEIDSRGRCLSLTNRRTGENLLRDVAPMAAMVAGGRRIGRTRCAYEDGRLIYTFGRDEAEAVIAVTEGEDYLTFEVATVRGEDVTSLTFLDLKFTMEHAVNAMSGVAATEEFGVCLRALNIDTFALGGSGARQLTANARSEHGIIGCGVALVGCPMPQLLPTLRRMVEREGLPKSELGGPWANEAEGNRGSYLFSNVTESNIDWWINLALRGGFTHVHFSGWQETLGHYEPRASAFPNGLEGIKECVRKVHAAGLKAGMHTLTGCISLRDSWVTPVPDPRLMADSVYTLAAEMDETSDTIVTVEKPQNHDVILSYSSSGNVIRIGEELIQYSAISFEEPYGFLNCTRGALGTTAGAHAVGEDANHLRQRYMAFYPDENSTLVGELADCIARVYNECEMDEIYMDGTEGMGTAHGMWVIRDAIYRRLKRPALIEASAWDTWSWYYHSRIGAWDHPKWALKDFVDMHCEGIPYYRTGPGGAQLQAQLGWWVILGPSHMNRAEMPDEMEYFNAKTFANDAPMSIQGVGAAGRPANARADEYITMTGRYERLRLAKYFSDDVTEQVAEPGADFHLQQADDGEWEFAPRRYGSHRVSSVAAGTEQWTVTNDFEAQPTVLRVEALFAALPYDSDSGVPVTDFADPTALSVSRDAGGVSHTVERVTDTVKVGEASLRYSATNTGESPVGAWAHAGMRFDPHLNIQGKNAMGVWVHGDGKGEVLNIQLSCPTQYMHAYSEHYVVVDFEGWRYFELLLRERSADGHRDYKWPYYSQHGIYRTFLNQQHVSELNLYLNNLPPGETATVYISPIMAVPTVGVELVEPTVTVNGQTVTIPATLQSGAFAEVDADGECRVYDWRCELRERTRVVGEMPELGTGANEVSFACAVPEVGAARADVVVISEDQVIRGRRPDGQINWRAMRYEYEMPRILEGREGERNQWTVPCRSQGKAPTVGVEMHVAGIGATGEAYEAAEVMTIESFDDLAYFAETADNEFAKYVYDGQHEGISTKPGVTQELTRSTDVVKVGEASVHFTATSTLEANGGWAARGRRFAELLDLSKYRGLGFWLHGDGKGESFKLQLRDPDGAWHDMVTRVDFMGWRYIEFDITGANLDLSKIEYMLIFFNGIPGGETVVCQMDDLRALPDTEGVVEPSITVGDREIVFPLTLNMGDRLVYRGPKDCQVYRKGTTVPEEVRTAGRAIKLRPGLNEVGFSVGAESPDEFRMSVTLVKDYGG